MSKLATQLFSRKCYHVLQVRLLNTDSLRTIVQKPPKPIRPPKIPSKKLTKNINAQDIDIRWSVTAYNLSEELKIKNVRKLLESFFDYQIIPLDQDVQDEAVMLSLISEDQEAKSLNDSPLNDVFLFSEGSVVFWGVPHEEQRRFVSRLSSLEVNPLSQELIQEEKEYINYTFTPNDKSRLAGDVVKLANKQDPHTLRLDQFAFSHAMALSCKLGVWECMLDNYIESVDWITENMKCGKELRLTRDQVFRKTGEIYELKHVINLSSDLLDLPDVYWDRHDQEIMYTSLISFLNIKRRTTVMNEKLTHCCELMNLLANHMNDKHHLRLEWMIIVLITVEVLFEIAKFL